MRKLILPYRTKDRIDQPVQTYNSTDTMKPMLATSKISGLNEQTAKFPRVCLDERFFFSLMVWLL